MIISGNSTGVRVIREESTGPHREPCDSRARGNADADERRLVDESLRKLAAKTRKLEKCLRNLGQALARTAARVVLHSLK